MVESRFFVLKGFVIFTLKLRSESASRSEQTVFEQTEERGKNKVMKKGNSFLRQ